MTNTEEANEEFYMYYMRQSGVYRLMTGRYSSGILMLELVQTLRNKKECQAVME